MHYNSIAKALGIPRLSTKLCLVMKMTAFLLLITFLHVSATSFSQQVHLSLKNAPLQKVFAAIIKEANVNIIYNEGILKGTTPVSIDVKGASVEHVLDLCLKNQPVYYVIENNIIKIRQRKEKALPAPLVADTLLTISGTVSGPDGTLLPGASVQVKETGSGTATDVMGVFSIKAKPGYTLLIRFIGYEKKEVVLGTEKRINIFLTPDAGGLNEVVVLGFGQTQKKVAQTGAISSIGTKELKQSPVANITNALAGRLPGLIAVQRSGEPGYDQSTLLMRGRATLNDASPIVTIDGIRKDYSAITLLDPNEVENITILKDASATALYGVKGANGVIIITTRRGKEGKAAINASVQRAIQAPVRLPKFLNAFDRATLANEAYKNDNPDGTLLPFTQEALDAYRTGSDPLKYPNVNWMEEMLKPSNLTRADFNISGGSPMVKYFVNVGYVQQDGIYKAEKQPKYNPNTQYKRYNFRSNVDIDFDKNFSMALNLFGAIENGNYPKMSAGDLFDMLRKVTPNAFPVRYPTGMYGGNVSALNPLYWLNTKGYTQNFNSSLSGMVSATRKLDFITKGLFIKGNYSFDGYFRNSFSRTRNERLAIYKGAGDYNNPDSYTYTGEDLPLSAPSSSFSQNRDIWMDLSLNYQRTFGNHSFTGLLLSNRTQEVRGGDIPYVSQGLVGRVAYSYKDKYFAEFNAGFNGTDNFAKGKRYGFFPAYSAGWLISEEPFLKGSSFVDLLKVRASYGTTGSDRLYGRRWLFISEYNSNSGYDYGDPLTWISGVTEGAMANPDISWEISKKTNLGLEFKILKNLFGLNVDVFREKRNNILITRRSIPSIIGVYPNNLPPANFGAVDNKGFEIELTHNNKIGQVTYFLRANTSFARNKILFMDEENKPFDYLKGTGNAIGQIFGLTAIGFFKDADDIKNSPAQFGNVLPGDLKYKDLNNDNIIDANDEGPIGHSEIPEIFYGIAGGVSWKNFDLSFLFQGAGNFNVMFSDQAAYEFVDNGNVMPEHLGRWTPATAGTATYPLLHSGFNVNNHRPSTFFMKDASYMRLKNLELGYTFKNVRLTKQSGFNSVRVYANGMNLYTWDKIGGSFDPETPSGRGNNYPQQKVYNIGLSVDF
jgi:TonB-linked SusC/RagA family outer membrane protein